MNSTLDQRIKELQKHKINRKISREHYNEEKWRIMLDAQANQELLAPLIRGHNPRAVITDSTGKTFCKIPRGPFIFGTSSEYCELNAAILVSQYPVTIREFCKFLDETDWDFPVEYRDKMKKISMFDECPACFVNWFDAKQYCRWLRRETDEYYSLPNEDEWEYAARGVDGRMYPWGYEEIDANLACYKSDYPYSGTIQVGTFSENRSPFGCMDMVGNVWEWCLDEFDYPGDPKILRGGSWNDPKENCTCVSRRVSFAADQRVENIGFRLVYLPGEMWVDYKKTL